MTDQATSAPVTEAMPTSTPAPDERRCPWCSQPLPASATDQCPSCHANLVATAADRLPGLTEVEAEATTRARRADAPKRSKLLAWISGDVDDESLPPSQVAAEAFAPPSKDVRREIWRLTLEAEGLEVLPDGEIVLPGATPADAPTAEASADAAPTGTPTRAPAAVTPAPAPAVVTPASPPPPAEDAPAS